MKKLLIQKATIVDSTSDFHGQQCDLLVSDGIISKIEKAGSIAEIVDEKISAVGLHVSPGWIDSGVVLADPGFEHKESLSALAKAAACGGFSRIICYPNTHPVIDHAQMVHALRQRSKHLPVQFHFMGALSQQTAGKELAEAYDMKQAGAIAFSDGLHPLQSSGLMLRALRYYQAFDGLVVSYPSEASLTEGGQMNESAQATQLGLKGIPEIAESGKTASLLELLSYTGGKLHLQPITSPMALQHVQNFEAKGAQLSIGGSIVHLCLDDRVLADFDENYKLFPPLRDAEQLKSLQSGLQQGAFNLLYSGHHAQSLEEKQLEFVRAEEGMIMLQTAFSVAYTHLVKSGLISLEMLVHLLSHGPRGVFGLKPYTISVGRKAELTLFQPEANWTFSTDHLFSPARNSPFLNQELQGKVVRVIR